MHRSVLREWFFFCILSTVDPGVSIFFITFLLDLLVSALSFLTLLPVYYVINPIYGIYNTHYITVSISATFSTSGDVLLVTALLFFIIVFLCHVLCTLLFFFFLHSTFPCFYPSNLL